MGRIKKKGTKIMFGNGLQSRTSRTSKATEHPLSNVKCQIVSKNK